MTPEKEGIYVNKIKPGAGLSICLENPSKGGILVIGVGIPGAWNDSVPRPVPMVTASYVIF
jgi:hypothetical protein